MADIARTVDVLTALPVTQLNDEWVKAIWDSDFTDIDPVAIPVDDDLQENDYYVEKLRSCRALLEEWITEKESESGEGFWTVLVENDIPHKNLIALLSHLMENGNRRVANGTQKQAAILAGSVYFKMISIPGSGAFKIFHPMLFLRVMDIFKMTSQSKISDDNKRKRKSSHGHNSQSTGRTKNRKKNVSNQSDDMEQSVNDNLNDQSDEDDGQLTPQEARQIHTDMVILLKDFVQLLDNFPLKRSDSSMHCAIETLVELTRHEPELFDGVFNNDRNLNRLSIPALAYKCLVQFCASITGDVNPIVLQICKELLSNILMLIGDNKLAAQNIPRSVQLAKDHALGFICYLLKEYADSIVPSVRILLQHMSTKVPDKALYRAKVSEAVVLLLNEFSAAHYARFIEWLYRLSRHVKINNRVFSLDVAILLLDVKERLIDESINDDLLPCLSHRYLIGIILARCSDLAPSVRARAITGFSNCIASKDSTVLGTIKEIVTPINQVRAMNPPRLIPTPETERVQTAEEPSSIVDGSTRLASEISSGSPQTIASETPLAAAIFPVPLQFIELTPGFNITVSDDQGVVSMLRRRAGDEKVNVRKAAIQALENIIRLDAPNYRPQDLNVLQERCKDPALSTRRQAMQSLTDVLLSFPADKALQKAWLDGVLPLVTDQETTLQEKTMEVVEEIILQNIVAYHRSIEENHKLTWGILDCMAGVDGMDLRRYLQTACQHWSRQGKIKTGLITALQSHISTENCEGAWMLLSEFAPLAPKFNLQFVVDYWNAKEQQEPSFRICQRVLSVIGATAKNISPENRASLIADLKSHLQLFDSPHELIAVTIDTLSKICDAQADGQANSRADKEAWCTELLRACDEYLSRVILNESAADNALDEETIERHLFTLGEIAQLCPNHTPRRVFMLVQSLVASPCISDAGTIVSTQDSSSQSSNAVENSQGTQSSQSTQPLSQFRGSRMSSRIRAHAFITLGKLCLQNEDLAKKCVAALARELETSPHPAIRNNVVIILCDLCVRYTTLVDRYVSNIAACLKDPSTLVRKQTLTLVTRLIQEDFLKWKGALFYRFITTLLDDNKEIREFAEFCLIHLLLQRHPTMFYMHFIECIFHFNGYNDHTVYNKFQQSDREKQMFSLKGKDNASRRLQLYIFMLEHMTDEHRFQLTAKICSDILGAVIDDTMLITPESSTLMQDSLHILSSKEIKLSSLRMKPQHDDIANELEMAAAVMATAKKTIITQVVKKNVIENIVPIVISLKHLLEKKHSPVIKDLMMYLRELMKDYKTEVKDILAADRQLASEIEFDLRKFEEQEAALERQRQMTTPAAVQHGSPKSPLIHQSPASKANTPKAGNQGTNPTTPCSRSPGLPPGTPQNLPTDKARRNSLSNFALLNSAKKAMQRAQQVTEARQSPLAIRRRATLSNAEEANRSSREQTPCETLFQTPNRDCTRAISTPSVALNNITFQADPNVTMIPPSPILTSGDRRACSTKKGNESATPRNGAINKENVEQTSERDILYLMSPDKPQPRPRTWNVVFNNTPKDTGMPAADGSTTARKSTPAT